MHFIKIKYKSIIPLEIMQRWKLGLKCRLGGPYDPQEKSSTNQSTEFRLTRIKMPTCSVKLTYQKLRHVEKGQEDMWEATRATWRRLAPPGSPDHHGRSSGPRRHRPSPFV